MHKYISGARALPGITVLVNLLVLIAYYNGLQERLMLYAVNQPESMDRIFYSLVFNNLGNAAWILLTVASIFWFYWDRLLPCLHKTLEHRYFILTMYSLLCVFGLLLIFAVPTCQIADARFYVEQADILVRTGSYQSPAGHLTAYWPAGLPFLLYGIMQVSNNPVLILQLLNLILLACTLWLSLRLFSSELSVKQQSLYALLFVMYPNTLFSVNAALTDFPSLFFTTAVLWLLYKSKLLTWHIVLAALMLAAACYFRPTNVFFSIPAVYLLWKRLRGVVLVKQVLLAGILTALLLLPWINRNYQVFHTFVPLASNGGFNFLMGNHKDSWGRVNFNFPYNDKNPDEAGESKQAYARAWQDIVEHPKKSAARLPLKLFFALMRGDSSFIWSVKDTGSPLPGILLALLFYYTNFMYYAILALALWALFRKAVVFHEPVLRTTWVIICGIYLLLILLYVGADRYVIPLYPVLFLLAVNGLTIVKQQIQQEL